MFSMDELLKLSDDQGEWDSSNLYSEELYDITFNDGLKCTYITLQGMRMWSFVYNILFHGCNYAITGQRNSADLFARG